MAKNTSFLWPSGVDNLIKLAYDHRHSCVLMVSPEFKTTEPEETSGQPSQNSQEIYT